MINSNLDCVYLISKERQRAEISSFKPLKPTMVKTQNEFETALLSSTRQTLWVSWHSQEFAPFLTRMPAQSLNRATHREGNAPVLLSFEAIRFSLTNLFESIFSKVVVARRNAYLPYEELAEVLKAENAPDLAIGGEVDTTLRLLTLIRGDFSAMAIPLSTFRETAAGVKPVFDDFKIEDHGQTVRFGKYEASVEALLYEFDPKYRQRQKKNLRATEKSFGASLRRLRLQRGLGQADLPGITAKEIGRIERGEVQRPHAKTIEKIAKILNVKPEEIETF